MQTPTCFSAIAIFRELTPIFHWKMQQWIVYRKHTFFVMSVVQVWVKNIIYIYIYIYIKYKTVVNRVIIYFICCCDEKMYRSALHLVLVYKHIFFLDPNWILRLPLYGDGIVVTAPRRWFLILLCSIAILCSSSPLVYSQPQLWQDMEIVGQCSWPVMLSRTWAQNCTGMKEDENHLHDDDDIITIIITLTTTTTTRIRQSSSPNSPTYTWTCLIWKCMCIKNTDKINVCQTVL